MQARSLRVVPETAVEQLDNTLSTASKIRPLANTSLIIRNVTVDGRRTSVRLEPEMWQSLTEICKRERCSIHNICTMIACVKNGPGSLTAAIRVFIMAYFRDAATEDGHNKVGHGSGSVLQPLYSKLARDAVRGKDHDAGRSMGTRGTW